MTDQDIKSVAEGLSEAQKRAVLKGHITYGAGYWPVRNAMKRKGLLSHAASFANSLTPLGLAVRTYLQEQSNDTN